jgi:hypothetical protein
MISRGQSSITVDWQVQPRGHVALSDFFPTLLQLFHLLLWTILIPRRKVEFGSSCPYIPG